MGHMHISRLPSGTWRVAVKFGGRRRTATAPTKAAAIQAGAELLLELGGSPKVKRVTVAELTAAWMVASTRLSATFRADAERVIERMPDTFATRPISDITPSVIEGLYRQLDRDGWSAHRIGRLHTVLSSAFTLAGRWEWVRANPFSLAKRPEAPMRKVTPPPAEAVTALLHAASARFALYLGVAAVTGARRGEVVGLQWADITGQQIRIRRSVAWTKQTDIVVTEGKTGPKGHRTVAIRPNLAAALEDHRIAQTVLADSTGGPAPVWVFSHTAGLTPWRPDYASREFRHLRDRLNTRPDDAGADWRAPIPESLRLHDLRHFVATQLLAAGVPLKTVGARLGHRQLSTTSDRYGDYLPAADREASDVMDRVLGLD